MEASTAGGQQAAGAPADGQQGAEQQQGQGFDPGQLVQGFEALASSQNETRELLRSLVQERQQGENEGEPESDPYELDLSFLAPQAQTAGDPDGFGLEPQQPAAPAVDPQQMQAQLAQALQQAVRQGVAAEVAPLQQQVRSMEHERAASALAQEFPALQDPETASEVVAIARQFATANGQPELGDQPWFWRLTYMAAEAAAQANDGSGEEPPAAVLEGAAGALPGGSSMNDVADQIVRSGGQSTRLPFG